MIFSQPFLFIELYKDGVSNEEYNQALNLIKKSINQDYTITKYLDFYHLMNFLKKTFFGSSKEQQKKQQTNINNQEDDIPIEILTQIFQKSAKCIAQTSQKIKDQDKLQIYGLYKQATVGDCNTPKPSMMDFVGKSKWNAWNNNKGITKANAMKSYISKAVQIDSLVQKKMQTFLNDESKNQFQPSNTTKKGQSSAQSGVGLKKVQKVDYSDTYSHPYFKAIQLGLPISKQSLTRQLLLQKNNSPSCSALHFAIDKQRVELVKEFLDILSVDQIKQLTDQDGTGIEEYAQLIQNQEIIQLVKQKLK